MRLLLLATVGVNKGHLKLCYGSILIVVFPFETNESSIICLILTMETPARKAPTIISPLKSVRSAALHIVTEIATRRYSLYTTHVNYLNNNQ